MPDPVSTAAEHDDAQTDEVLSAWSHQRLAELQKADPAITVICQLLESRVEPTRDEIMPHSAEVKAYASQRTSLVVVDGVVYRKYGRSAGSVQFYQLLVPRVLREELFEQIHAGAAGHLGSKKPKKQVQRSAY